MCYQNQVRSQRKLFIRQSNFNFISTCFWYYNSFFKKLIPVLASLTPHKIPCPGCLLHKSSTVLLYPFRFCPAFFSLILQTRILISSPTFTYTVVSFHPHLLKIFFIGAVLVSTVQQNDSTVCIPASPPFGASSPLGSAER